MNRIISLTADERRQIFLTAAAKLKIPAEMIEKDFWVCRILDKLFSDPQLSSCLRFKGGTSLSKVFNLIKRFSEDIDLILDWRCITPEDPLQERSNNKQDLFNKKIQSQSGEYISTELYEVVSRIMGKECSVSADSQDPNILLVEYPKSFSASYITPHIKLEIGPLASWLPNDKFSITPYIAEAFPELKIDRILVPTILAERTFWEKVTILHQEYHRPQESSVPLRYSRHYYDLFMMSQDDFLNNVLQNTELLKSVVNFKRKFYPRNWARYDLAIPGSIKLLPAEHSRKALQKDYKDMKNMIFGYYPSWEEICEKLAAVEEKINKL